MNFLVEALERKEMTIICGWNVVDLIANHANAFLDLCGKLCWIVKHEIGSQIICDFATSCGTGKFKCVLDELEQLPDMCFALGPDGKCGGDVKTFGIWTNKRMRNDRVENNSLYKHTEYG